MIKPKRQEPLWLAFIVHRISGIALAVFLPFHFWVLSLALTDTARLNTFLHWTEHPLVSIAEFGLVFLLCIHFFGGIRLMAMEWLPWSDKQKTFAAMATAFALLVAGVFLLKAV
ncbi:MAG: succinate dehydrogenase, cytochrome b556 subunit [Gammaproteobacteria bacterium]|nr:succinate dehydrogenase, cytochrome b556 subunit [Gammaproteobacteria bacterium]